MTIFKKIDNLLKECHYLNDLAIHCNDYDTCLLIREKEEKIYNQYLFYKNYLLAERKIKK